MLKSFFISLIVPVYEKEYDVVPNIEAIITKLNSLIDSRLIEDYELLIYLSESRYNSLPLHLTIGNKLYREGFIDWQVKRGVRFFNCEHGVTLGEVFRRGIDFTHKEYVGLITPYNQVSLESLDPILKALRDHDMVVAYISNHSARPWYRTLASEVNTLLINLLFCLNLKYYHLCFYRSKLVKKVPLTTCSHAMMVEAAVWIAKSGSKIVQVPFKMIPHNFKSKSQAFRIENITNIFKTYLRLFWQVMVLRKRIDLS